MRIDSHQHFWTYHPVKHDWIDEEMAVIRKDFFPENLEPVLKENNFDGCVAVQADQTLEETNFLIKLAEKNTFIKGVVGWVDLKSDDLESTLIKYKEEPIVKGFRHVLQGEKPEFMLDPLFKRGISLLKKYNYTYDLLLFPQHLKAAIELVKENPEQKFVIDHIAKPLIKQGIIGDWEKDIKEIASYKNVLCKVSGMVTEADYKNWKAEDFIPYLAIIEEAFGADRIMFGSDWPVCLVAASYQEMLDIPKNYFSKNSSKEQELIFGLNAKNFYQL